MGKKRKRKRTKPVPDDHFRAGPLEFARFGKVMVGQSHASAEQIEVAQAERAAHFPVVVAEIDNLVAEIADLIAHLPPDQLLHRAWWEFAMTVIPLKGKNIDNAESAIAMRMIDYVQSVIVSVNPKKPYTTERNEEDWNRLKKNVETLFKRLAGEYQWYLTAHRQAQDPNLDMALEKFRFRAELFWMNVRGKRYQPHERQSLLDTLTPHLDVLVSLFGIDARTLVGELDKVLMKLTFGLGEAFTDMKCFQEDTCERLTKLAKDTGITDTEELRDRLFEDPDLAARRDKVIGELLGLDLFDVEKITQLPKVLLSELTWSPGEEKEFFAPGEFCGWPLRVWPTMTRPFIRLEKRVLCFDIFTLFDNFYRVIQRVIFRLAPDYKETWNTRQNQVSEALPFIYFERLLPGAQVYRPIYYPWKVDNGPTQWHEADGLVIYADHLFVIEVKAGAFTYTSPATDLSSHITSLENLVKSPASQGRRLVDYLESAVEVAIFDAEHKEIGLLRSSDFRHITVCAITLDAFTELAARAQHLREIGIDVGQRPVWVLSIDDLRVCADIFDNPLIFLHFVEQRMRASCSKLVDLNDEMDHLGLYIVQNNYSQFADELVGSNNHTELTLNGYRTPIDEYYSSIVRGDPLPLPKQEMPRRLTEIINFLASSTVPYRSKVASFLLDMAGDFRTKLNTGIEQLLRENVSLRRPRPLSTSNDIRLTLVCWSPPVLRQAAFAVEHTKAVMISNNETSRSLIELEYTEQGELTDVHWQQISLGILSKMEIDRLRPAATRLKRHRLSDVKKQYKIGPNDPCPCGSGKKYKRCCRP